MRKPDSEQPHILSHYCKCLSTSCWQFTRWRIIKLFLKLCYRLQVGVKASPVPTQFYMQIYLRHHIASQTHTYAGCPHTTGTPQKASLELVFQSTVYLPSLHHTFRLLQYLVFRILSFCRYFSFSFCHWRFCRTLSVCCVLPVSLRLLPV